jgi:hypothetical protein
VGGAVVAGGVLVGLAACAVLEQPAGAVWPTLRKPGRENLALAEPVRRLARGGPVAALDTSLNPYFPILLHAELDWSLRYPFLFQLPALYADVPPDARSVPYRSPRDRGAIEQELVDALVEDLRAHPPSLVLVRRAPQYRMRNQHFDIVAWLERDPRFSELWRSYECVQRLPGHDIWIRRP